MKAKTVKKSIGKKKVKGKKAKVSVTAQTTPKSTQQPDPNAQATMPLDTPMGGVDVPLDDSQAPLDESQAPQFESQFSGTTLCMDDLHKPESRVDLGVGDSDEEGGKEGGEEEDRTDDELVDPGVLPKKGEPTDKDNPSGPAPKEDEPLKEKTEIGKTQKKETHSLKDDENDLGPMGHHSPGPCAVEALDSDEDPAFKDKKNTASSSRGANKDSLTSHELVNVSV